MITEQYDEDQQRKYIKIVLVGESGVGKSNIISRYVQNKFSIGSNATIGLQFTQKHVDINGKHMILQIWDTAGQERFRALNKTFYKNSLGALVIFDLSSRASFQNLGRWIAELKDNLDESAILLLIGNKSDIKDQKVLEKQAFQLAKKQNMMYLQASAALGYNVRDAFELLTKKIIARGEQLSKFTMKTIKRQPLKLQARKEEATLKKKKCC